jgi:hypothetical protein
LFIPFSVLLSTILRSGSEGVNTKAATTLASFCSRNGLHVQLACSRVLADNETESSSLH